ncbi:MAG: hypothetical protein ABW185_06400 [Sedimenticola sp.]
MPSIVQRGIEQKQALPIGCGECIVHKQSSTRTPIFFWQGISERWLLLLAG